MRHVATILLLCVAVVACDAFTERELGVVIDGLCPAEIAPETVGPTFRDGRWGEGYDLELLGRAHKDKIEIEWGIPPSSDTTGYIVARLSYDARGKLEHDSMRTFEVNEVLGDRRYSDTTDVAPSTNYRYRVIPVTAAGLGFPSWPVDIWSLPAEKPDPPLTATVQLYRGSSGSGWELRATHSFLKPANDALVARRESADMPWQIVREPEIRTQSEYFPYEGDIYWFDEESDPNVEYEYAVCFANRAGIGIATLLITSLSLDSRPVSVSVDPPRDIDGAANDSILTLYWTASDDPQVRGYGVEREKVNDDDTYALQSESIGQAASFQRYSVARLPDVPQHRFRVRALTSDGQGPWSEWVAVDLSPTADSQVSTPKPKILAAVATNDQVDLVWHVAGSFDGLQVRYLRRQTRAEGEFKAYQSWNWIDSIDFNWDYAYPVESTRFTDEHDVRPDTEYEYAVQLKRGAIVGPASDPVSVRTGTHAGVDEGRPLPVLDFEAEPKSDGVRLTWELPADSTLEGILVIETRVYNGHPGRFIPFVTLRPDQNEYMALKRGFSPDASYYAFDIKTFNDFGKQAVGFQREFVYVSDMLHFTMTTEEVERADEGHHLTVRFRSCDEASTEVVRHELTADGFDVTDIDQPCAWVRSEPLIRRGFDYFEGTLVCEYVDTSVKPGTWYIYELTQALADGREFTSTHEIVTRPIYDAP